MQYVCKNIKSTSKRQEKSATGVVMIVSVIFVSAAFFKTKILLSTNRGIGHIDIKMDWFETDAIQLKCNLVETTFHCMNLLSVNFLPEFHDSTLQNQYDAFQE